MISILLSSSGEGYYVEFLGEHNGEVVFNGTENTTKCVFGENDVLDINGTKYMGVEANTSSYILVDENGTIKELNLTASERTTWVIDGKSYEVSEGTRVEYYNGEVRVFSPEDGGEFKLKTGFGEQMINFGTGSEVLITGNKISGENIFIGGMELVSGGILMTDKGKVVQPNSEIIIDNVRIKCNKKVLISPVDDNLGWENYIYADYNNKYLSASGEEFSLSFERGTPYAIVKDDLTKFEIVALKDTKFSIENREDKGLIPLVELGGDFKMEQDGRTLTNNNKQIKISRVEDITKGVVESEKPYSSAMEIKYDCEDEKEKYIINSLRGFAKLDIDENEEYSDINLEDEEHSKYGDKRFFQKVSNLMAYNYPTRYDFEKIVGSKVNLVGEISDDNYELWGTMISYYETLDEEHKQLLGNLDITIYEDRMEMLSAQNIPAMGIYDDELNAIGYAGGEGSIFTKFISETTKEITGEGKKIKINYKRETPISFSTFHHEMAHAYDDYLSEQDSELYLGIKIEETMMSQFKEEWIGVINNYFPEGLEQALVNDGYGNGRTPPKSDSYYNRYGVVTEYGFTNTEEDIAEFNAIIKSAPREYLCYHNSLILKDIAQDKINLLLKYGHITQEDWNYLDEISYGVLSARDKYDRGEISNEEWNILKEQAGINISNDYTCYHYGFNCNDE